MIAAIFAFLGTSIGRWIVGCIAVAAIASGAYTYLRVHYYNSGYSAAIAAVAAKNKEATDAVNKATAGVDACINSGGAWDTTRGLCVK